MKFLFRMSGDQLAVLPPLTLMIWPVMNEALSEARNSNRVRQFFGLARPPERNTCEQSRLAVRGAGEAIEHGGLDRPGRNRIDADAESRGLQRAGFGQAFDRMLAGGVKRRVRSTAAAHGRGNVDNVAEALGLHHAQFVLHAEEHTEHVGIEGRRVTFRRLLGHRPRNALGAGVVDRDVEAAEPRDGLVDHRTNVIFLADVSFDEVGFRTERAKLFDKFRAGFLASSGDDHVCAFSCEGHGGGASDARQSAGDQYNPSNHDELLMIGDSVGPGVLSRCIFRDQVGQLHRRPATSRPEIALNRSEIVLKFGRCRRRLSSCKRRRPGAILLQSQTIRSVPGIQVNIRPQDVGSGGLSAPDLVQICRFDPRSSARGIARRDRRARRFATSIVRCAPATGGERRTGCFQG